MALQTHMDSPLAAAVRKAGSQAKYASIVGRTQPSIHRDLQQNKPVALEDVPLVEAALGIPRHELRPDYFEAPSPDPAQHPVGQPSASASCSASGQGADGSRAGSGTDPLEGLAA